MRVGLVTTVETAVLQGRDLSRGLRFFLRIGIHPGQRRKRRESAVLALTFA